MVQLALLLVGMQAFQRHWRSLALIGVAWILIGLIVMIDPLDGVQDISMNVLGSLLVLEGVVTLGAGVLAGWQGWLWIVRAAVLIVPGLMIIEVPWRNHMLNSVLFGVALTADGTLRILAALIVRFPGWRLAVAAGAVEFVLAALAFSPWPVSYEATVPFCVGVALVLSGWAVLRSARLLRDLPPDAPITTLPIFHYQRGWLIPPLVPGLRPEAANDTANPRTIVPQMIVHVWTPVASATDPVRRPLIDRYIAAVDQKGTVSTGHAALEMPPDLYISHYRVAGQDRTQLEFRQALNAGHQNDVPGRFLPSYAYEVGEWCEATEDVVFHRFRSERLRRFWAAYRQDSTYNLTNRNCSVAVALALNVALEGVLGGATVWTPLGRLILHPDLYLAALLRKRAQSMTWTPGLVLDYARALHRVVEPPSLSWPGLVRQAVARYRHIRSRQSPATATADPIASGAIDRSAACPCRSSGQIDAAFRTG
jgi:uncharacterized membrane protein HdeD (DUF308 family)